MFGKRSGNDGGYAGRQAPPRSRRASERACRRRDAPARRVASPPNRAGQPPPARAVEPRRSENYYHVKTTDLRRPDRHDRPVAARQARRRIGARGNPRHRQRNHRDQERRDVDRRAGGPARGHLQRRARLRPARAAACPRRHRRHHGQRRRHDLHRSQRQGPADQRPLPRQRAADEHLPAHRQPGRPPRRRILADLRRAPARRLPRQRHRPAAGDRRAGAHHPQVQEGQADPRPAGPVRLDHAGGRARSCRSSAASAATSSSPAAPARARPRCSTA